MRLRCIALMAFAMTGCGPKVADGSLDDDKACVEALAYMQGDAHRRGDEAMSERTQSSVLFYWGRISVRDPTVTPATVLEEVRQRRAPRSESEYAARAAECVIRVRRQTSVSPGG